METKEEVFDYIKKNDITFINLWFPDILGQLVRFSCHKDVIEDILEEGLGFDGSSTEGFVRIEESDLLAKPIPSTFIELPYRPQEDNKVAAMFCEIYNPDPTGAGETRFEGDSLFVLERQLERMRSMGFDTFNVGAELEFFLFKDNKPGEIRDKLTDQGGYCTVTDDEGVYVRRDIILDIKKMGIEAEISHHEVAPSQSEIDFKYKDALSFAMSAMAYRRAAKEIAKKKHNQFVSFMPKPLYGENGSGMHVHQSLFTEGRNAFYNPEDEFHLSETAKHYIAGILKHAPEFAAVTNQWVNSYQRLVPGYEAPTELSWARKNRSTAVRIPMYKPGKEKATRIEVRFPDPACNLPLAFAVMLGAGLEGIEKQYELSEPVEENIYSMNQSRRDELGIKSLPSSLEEATDLMEKSDLVRKVLGEHIHSGLVANQREEWNEYFREVRGKDREDHLVTKYELEKLLPIL